jgi:hypothetical protein
MVIQNAYYQRITRISLTYIMHLIIQSIEKFNDLLSNSNHSYTKHTDIRLQIL